MVDGIRSAVDLPVCVDEAHPFFRFDGFKLWIVCVEVGDLFGGIGKLIRLIFVLNSADAVQAEIALSVVD